MMNRFEGPGAKEARIRYLDGDFQVTSPGSFVRCAVTGEQIRSTSCATGAWRGRSPTSTPPYR